MRNAVYGIALSACLALLAVAGLYAYCTKDLPSMDVFHDPARHAELLESMYHLPSPPPYRIEPCAYEDMPQALIDAFLVAENLEYFTKPGHDVYRLAFPTSRLVQGLMVENLHYPRSIFPRIKFFFLCKKFTLCLSKEEILCVFLNTKYYGGHVYGVGAASSVYLGKDIRELSIADCATLLALIRYTLETGLPEIHRLKQSQEHVLGRLLDYGRITPEEYGAAMEQELRLFNYVSRDLE